MPKAKSKELGTVPAGKVRFIEPMYAKPVPELPEGSEWQYEIKFDGYRCLAGKTQKDIDLWSLRGNLYTQQFAGIAAAGKVLDRDTLIDGELVALDENDRPSFNLLQHFRSKPSAIQYYVFDLIFYRGKSLLEVPLDARRKLLSRAIKSLGEESPIRLTESLNASRGDIISAAKEHGFEGIIAKRKDSYYESGKRTGAWVKYKGQQVSGIRDWRIHAWKSYRCNYRWLLPRRKAFLC